MISLSNVEVALGTVRLIVPFTPLMAAEIVESVTFNVEAPSALFKYTFPPLKPVPDCTVTSPPAAAVLAPAVNVSAPPAKISLVPTERAMVPALPLVAAPVLTITLPEEPAEDNPVEIVTAPVLKAEGEVRS